MEREEFERVEGVAPAETPRIPETEYQSHFPKKFDFFGMGRVEAAPRACNVAECASAEFLVTFQVMGDELGLCVVAFERIPARLAPDSPDSGDEQRSMLVELANIVASKFVTQMADFNCCDIMVSPPTVAASAENEPAGTRSRHRYLASTLAVGGTRASVARRYELVTESATIQFRLAYMPSLQGGNT